MSYLMRYPLCIIHMHIQFTREVWKFSVFSLLPALTRPLPPLYMYKYNNHTVFPHLPAPARSLPPFCIYNIIITPSSPSYRLPPGPFLRCIYNITITPSSPPTGSCPAPSSNMHECNRHVCKYINRQILISSSQYKVSTNQHSLIHNS